MKSCPFCREPQQQQGEIIARNDLCYLLGNPEGALQHGMLIIPFRHIESPFEFTQAEWAALQPMVNRANELLTAVSPDGFNLGWNVGEVGGQEVAHVHLHVFARFADEPFAGAGIRKWFKSEANSRPLTK